MQAWENFLASQDEQLGRETTTKWLRSLRVVHFDACNLYLEAKDSFQALWFEEHIRPKIQGKLLNNNSRSIKVHLTVAEETSTSLNKKKREKKSTLQPPPLFPGDDLDPLATLENFIISPDNQLNLEILKETLRLSQPIFNPIYLYGGSGNGKTHLLMALAHAFKQQGKSILFVRAETFTEHVVSAIRSGTMREFRKAYRHIDVLFIDEVSIFGRRAATQEELFHTFNTLHMAHKCIFLSGSTPPIQLADIEPRLISRFEWGITLCIGGLKEPELKQLLEQRANSLDFLLGAETSTLLLEKFKNAKALIRALEALVLRAHVERQTAYQITPQLALYYLKDLLEEEMRSAMTPLKIIRAVSDFYGILPDDILSKSHSHECAFPRQMAMYLCRQRLQIPFQKIGSLFSRDHSTVMTSVKGIQKKLDRAEPDVVSALQELLIKF